ncbi:MAG: cation diffusion facilitator family transporter [Vampirovibrionales bacterium]|nr:cation diffusion facilitator family transporter [Vampirovibrionales bacterium]
MECRHGHHHLHHHHHHEGLAEGLSSDNIKRLRGVLFISIGYLLLQLAGGYFSGSLALMAEAGHKFSDMLAIALALIAAWLATRASTEHRTFGFGRAEILVALGNALVLLLVCAEIIKEAVERLSGHHHEIDSGLMIAVASIGLILNLFSLGILKPSKNRNLNIRGAYLHVMTDMAGSAGTLISAILIWFTHWLWLDLALSILIALLVFSNAIRILAEALHILLEAAPRSIDLNAVERFLLSLPNVKDVHDLHVWTITTGKDALLVHTTVAGEHFVFDTATHIEQQLRERFGFCHITVQLEPEGFEEAMLPF